MILLSLLSLVFVKFEFSSGFMFWSKILMFLAIIWRFLLPIWNLELPFILTSHGFIACAIASCKETLNALQSGFSTFYFPYFSQEPKVTTVPPQPQLQLNPFSLLYLSFFQFNSASLQPRLIVHSSKLSCNSVLII